MESNKLYRLTVLTLLAALGAVAVSLTFVLLGAWSENKKLLRSEEMLLDQIDKLAKEKDYKEEYYFRLSNDDKFRERIIREKLGYATAKELVFRFDDAAGPVKAKVTDGNAKEAAAKAPQDADTGAATPPPTVAPSTPQAPAANPEQAARRN